MVVSSGLDALAAYRTDIEAAIRQFFAEAPQLLGAEVSDRGQQALQQLESYCLRPGKRIRGSLAALTYDSAAGTQHDTAAIQLGVVLELMQAYLLIIDDVMDRSEVRRGEPAMQVLYREHAPNNQVADMAAINVGLLGQHLASLALARIPVSADAIVQASEILQRNIALTGFGQLDDVMTSLDGSVTEADITRKYVLKSSYYTFVNPLQLGFALAGQGDEPTLAACEAFGTAAGIAFQLTDDMLGMFGDPRQLGKSTLDDLREGKYTLLVHFALTHADAAEAARLRRSLGDPAASADDLLAAQAVLESSGARAYCTDQARVYADQAKHVLSEQAVGTATYRELLSGLVEYSVSREQ